MTFDVEIMLRHTDRVFSETMTYDREPRLWSAADAEIVLRKILAAMGRVANPGAEDPEAVTFRGVSWIVSPYEQGVVIAFEIQSASAVAGPFDIALADLERLVGQAMQTSQPRTTVH
jgi:hypothetical protein